MVTAKHPRHQKSLNY